MARARYDMSKLEVEEIGSRDAAWDFARKTVRGVEHVYAVRDTNVRARNRWEFVVRVPHGRGERIEVRPIKVPNQNAWSGLERSSITFQRATRQNYAGKWYCKISLADPTGSRTKTVIRLSERHLLPSWFQSIEGSFRGKATVKPTRGSDASALVATVDRDDHARMIGFYFAMKVWVLREGFRLPEREA
jgi:hypothetical protein